MGKLSIIAQFADKVTSHITGGVRAKVVKLGTSVFATPTKNTKTIAEQAAELWTRYVPKTSTFYNLPEENQNIILNFRKNIIEMYEQGKSPTPNWQFKNVDSFIISLTNLKLNKSELEAITKNFDSFYQFACTRTNVNKLFFLKNQKVKAKLALMLRDNKENYDKLLSSNFWKKIQSGEISETYLEKLDFKEDIKTGFFKDLLSRTLKPLDERTERLNINKEQLNKILGKLNIIKSPETVEGVISEIEKIKNSKMVDRVLAQFLEKEVELDSELLDKTLKGMSSLSKEQLEKLSKIKGLNPLKNSFMFNQYITLLKEDKIPDTVFNFYQKVLQIDSELCDIWTLRNLNDLYNISSKKDSELFNLFADKLLTSKYSTLLSLVERVRENNIEIFKDILKTEDIWSIDYKSCILKLNNPELSKNPEILENLEKLSSEIGIESTKLQDLQKSTIDQFEQIGLFDLIKDKKISVDLLKDFCYGQNNLTPELLSDIELIKAGKTLVKHFDSIKNVLKETNPGDVISSNGKMYINNNGKLEPWNMTEEKFNELFPLGNRFIFRQQTRDCYLVSVMKGLYENPRTRGQYYKMFEQQGDDILVTIPCYKDSPIIYRKSNRIHYDMLEETYWRTAKRDGEVSTVENPLTTDNIKYLEERVSGGQPIDVIKEFLPNRKGVTLIEFFENLSEEDKIKSIEEILKKYCDNNKYLIEYGRVYNDTGHSMIIKSIDKEQGFITISDPENSGTVYYKSLEDISKTIHHLLITQL